MSHKVLSHTADTGVEATADTLAELLRNLADGMFGLMGTLDPCLSDHGIEAEVESASYEDLAVDVLSELLYHSEVENLFLCWFEMEMAGRTRVRIRAAGIANADVDLTGPPIKAVTYHDVAVTETDEGWYGRVYFDV